MINLVNRATATADELAPEEFVAGRKRLAAKVRRYRPRAVAFLGVGAYRHAFGLKSATIGPQPETFEGAARLGAAQSERPECKLPAARTRRGCFVLSKAQLAEAVGSALAGNWHAAHEIVQQDEQDEVACWIHAVLHRLEGDLPNAQYWYARCGRRLRKAVPPEDELREIDAALRDR